VVRKGSGSDAVANEILIVNCVGAGGEGVFGVGYSIAVGILDAVAAGLIETRVPFTVGAGVAGVKPHPVLDLIAEAVAVGVHPIIFWVATEQVWLANLAVFIDQHHSLTTIIVERECFFSATTQLFEALIVLNAVDQLTRVIKLLTAVNTPSVPLFALITLFKVADGGFGDTGVEVLGLIDVEVVAARESGDDRNDERNDKLVHNYLPFLT